MPEPLRRPGHTPAPRGPSSVAAGGGATRGDRFRTPAHHRTVTAGNRRSTPRVEAGDRRYRPASPTPPRTLGPLRTAGSPTHGLGRTAGRFSHRACRQGDRERGRPYTEKIIRQRSTPRYVRTSEACGSGSHGRVGAGFGEDRRLLRRREAVLDRCPSDGENAVSSVSSPGEVGRPDRLPPSDPRAGSARGGGSGAVRRGW